MVDRIFHRLIDATPRWLQPFLPWLIWLIGGAAVLLLAMGFRWSGDSSGWYTLGAVFGFVMGIFATIGYFIEEEEAEQERQQQAHISSGGLRYPTDELKDVTPYPERPRD